MQCKHAVLLLTWLTLCLAGFKLNADDHGAPHLTVLTYNVFMRYPDWIFHNNHDERSQLIPGHLTGYDAVVLQEAFSDSHRHDMASALKDDYPHISKPLGANEFFSHNGGVAILSRWPIKAEQQYVFDVCEGPDCMVKKGVIYTALATDIGTVHLFGLHLQAEVEFGATRLQQVDQLREFIDSIDIAADEPVIVAGDFNIDLFTDDRNQEYSHLKNRLGFTLNESNAVASYETASNTMLEDDDVSYRERLDYVVSLDDHLKPASQQSEVKYLRHEGNDLSDHHAVLGSFWFAGDE